MFRRFFLALALLFFTSNAWGATLVNDGSINWNGNWQTVGKTDTLHASTNLVVDSTTSRQSGTWNGDNTKTDIGVLAFINTSAATGTMTVALQQDSGGGFADTASTTTIVQNGSTNNLSWYFFKYGSSHTETTGTANYRINFTSNTATDTLMRVNSAATTVVAIIQVYSATATIAAADATYVIGVCTACSSDPSAATVTVNVNLNGTSYGAVDLNNQGTLAWSVAASTTTYLEVAGDITLRSGSALTMGTVASPMPSTSLATFEMETTGADRAVVINAGAQFILQGNAKFGTATQYRTTTTDAIAVTTDRTVSTAINVQTAGWAANDEIVISGTGGTGQSEKAVISSVSGASLTINADWANTHLSGAHIFNLTRNVLIIATGANNSTITMNSTTSGNVDLDWVELDSLSPQGPNQGAFDSNGGDASQFDIDNCAFDSVGLSGQTTTPAIWVEGNNLTLTNLAFWGNSGRMAFLFAADVYNNITINNFITLEGGAVNASAFNQQTGSALFQNFVIGDRLSSTGNIALIIMDAASSTMENGYIFGAASTLNAGTGLSVTRTSFVTLKNVVFGSDGTTTLSNGTQDVNTGPLGRILAYNSTFNNATETAAISATDSHPNDTYFRSYDHDATQYRFKSIYRNGTVSDQVTGGQAAGWARSGSTAVYFNPSSTTESLDWNTLIPVTASTGIQVTAYVIKTVTAGTCTLTCTIYDDDDDSTVLLNAESVPLTNAWAQYTSTSVTPTDNGFVRVKFSALDGGTTCDIGIDDIDSTPEVDVDFGNMERWRSDFFNFGPPYETDSTTGAGSSSGGVWGF